MELIDKIKAIIGRLEDIRNQSNPDFEIIKGQADLIENEELLNLDEEFDEWRNSLYDAGEPNEETGKIIDEIGDLFIQADELIVRIRQQFHMEDVYDDIDNLDDDELVRTSWDDEEDYNDAEDVEFDIVLNEVSKSALIAIGFDNEDENSIKLMGTILIGISSEDSDDAIAGRVLGQLAMSGFMLPMEDIKEMCRKTREKCKKQLFGLQIAMNSLQEYHCSAEDALTQIAMFL
jgi:hypothetical protein